MTKQILVVDDDDAIVDALLILLEYEGFSAQQAKDVNLVDRVARLQPSAVLLDVWLAGRDGRELCRTLKTDERTAHIPVILISASRELAASAANAGADGYIEKPFEMAKVIHQLHQVT